MEGRDFGIEIDPDVALGLRMLRAELVRLRAHANDCQAPVREPLRSGVVTCMDWLEMIEFELRNP